MRLRSAPLLALAAVPLAGVPASVASPRLPKVCQLVTDAPEDTSVPLAGSAIEAPSLDVLSADVASGAKDLVAAIRVRSLATDPATATGAKYVLYVTIGKTEYAFELLRRAGSADEFRFYPSATPIEYVGITGNTDANGAQVNFVADRKLAGKFDGAKLTGLRVVASLTTGSQVDAATSTRTYVDRQPSCLPAT